MTIPEGIRKLLDFYDVNDSRLALTFKVVPDAEFISNYGNEPFGKIEVTVPESINERLAEELGK